MARIEVPMPQMGESIAEGTVSKWLKAVGQPVERDEPILEISTDKVDAEIPAPASGTLVAIEVQEGETVEVGTIVAYIDPEAPPSSNGGAPAGEAEEAAPAAAKAVADEKRAVPEPAETEAPVDQGPAQPAAATAPAPVAAPSEGDEAREQPPAGDAEERLPARSTPVVRRIAEEHGVDLAQVEGTGHAGRVTKQDILAYIESGKAAERSSPAPAAEAAAERVAPTPSPPRGGPRRAGGPRSARARARQGRTARAFRLLEGVLWTGPAPRVPGARRRPGRADGQDPPAHRRTHGRGQADRCPRALLHRDRLHGDRSGPEGEQEGVGGAGRPGELHRLRRVGRGRACCASSRI